MTGTCSLLSHGQVYGLESMTRQKTETPAECLGANKNASFHFRIQGVSWFYEPQACSYTVPSLCAAQPKSTAILDSGTPSQHVDEMMLSRTQYSCPMSNAQRPCSSSKPEPRPNSQKQRVGSQENTIFGGEGDLGLFKVPYSPRWQRCSFAQVPVADQAISASPPPVPN